MAAAFTLLNQRDLVFSRMVHDYLMGRRKPLTDLMAWNADATHIHFTSTATIFTACTVTMTLRRDATVSTQDISWVQHRLGVRDEAAIVCEPFA